eukprot:gene29903-biopygen11650
MRKMFVDTYKVVDNGMHGLEKMNLTGNLNANRIKLGDKWTLSGVGDKHGNDDWLQLFNKYGTGYYGGLAAGRLWSGGAAHLNGPTSTRDINANGNVNVTRAVNASGNLCVQNECLNKTDLHQIKKALADATLPKPPSLSVMRAPRQVLHPAGVYDRVLGDHAITYRVADTTNPVDKRNQNHRNFATRVFQERLTMEK